MSLKVPARPGRAAAAKKPVPAGKPRLSRAQQNAERGHKLLDSAWALFCERGYEGVTIEDVADHAGFSRQPVYTLFGDKQNLFFELQRSFIAELKEILFGVMPAGQTLRSNLSRLAGFVADAMASDKPNHGHHLFFVAQTIALSRTDIASTLAKEANEIVSAVGRMIARSSLGPGEVLRDEPDHIAAHLVGIINGMTTVQFQTSRRFTNERDLNDIFVAIALRSQGS